ncbi:MAG: Holliday junction branch migration protein RuvA [Deltaproteobacteria bacterium]|nr:Holliday junction branch migration protein RuvA [Deltaproteobacteria bacterium]
MISHIRGTVLALKDHAVTVDIGGVGFELFISEQTKRRLPALGSIAFFQVHFHVREDAIQLYGFSTSQEKSLFEAMISISGIGPRGAITMLSSVTPEEFQRAILREDVKFLTSVPGIGKKTAERLIVELKEKMTRLELGEDPISPFHGNNRERKASPYNEALEALLALGYNYHSAQRTIHSIRLNSEGAEESVENIVRASLKLLRDL